MRNNNYFKGVFDGNGYSIKNLNIVAENYKDIFDDDIKNDVALFGKLLRKNRNLTVENSTFEGFCAAVFARSCSNSHNAIINCISKNNTIIGTRCGEIVDDYCGSIRSVLAINNKCTSKGYIRMLWHIPILTTILNLATRIHYIRKTIIAICLMM